MLGRMLAPALMSVQLRALALALALRGRALLSALAEEEGGSVIGRAKVARQGGCPAARLWASEFEDGVRLCVKEVLPSQEEVLWCVKDQPLG